MRMSHIPSFISAFAIFLIMNLEYLIDVGKWFDNILPKWRLNLTSTFFFSPGKGFTVGSIPQIVIKLPGNWLKSFHNQWEYGIGIKKRNFSYKSYIGPHNYLS